MSRRVTSRGRAEPRGAQVASPRPEDATEGKIMRSWRLAITGAAAIAATTALTGCVGLGGPSQSAASSTSSATCR